MAFLSRIKKLASETAIYGISTIVGRLVNYLLVPIYLSFFDPELYGIVGLVYTSFLILNHVFQHGMESAYLKFASGKEGRGQVGQVFSTATWSLLGISLGLSGLILLFRMPLSNLVSIGPDWAHLWYFAVAILTMDALSIVPFAELRLQNRPINFAAVKLANILINVGLNLVLIIGFAYGIEAIFISNLVASVCTFLLLLPMYGRLLRGAFHFPMWKQLMVFGLPFIPSGLSYAFVDRVNLFFLGRMDAEQVLALYRGVMPDSTFEAAQAMGDVVFGQYVVGIFNGVWKLGVFMMLVVQMFRFAWQPFFLQHAEDEDAPQLFSRVFTVFTAGSLFVLLGVAFFIDILVAIPNPLGGTLMPEAYWFALYLVPIAMVGYFFQGLYFNFTAGAYIEKKTSYFVVCTFAGAVVSLLINIFLIPYYGMLAAAWATAIAYAVMAVTLLFIVRRFYPVPYDWWAVGKTAVLAAGLYALWEINGLAENWLAEAGLLFGYIAGLIVFRVVPWHVISTLFRISR